MEIKKSSISYLNQNFNINEKFISELYDYYILLNEDICYGYVIVLDLDVIDIIYIFTDEKHRRNQVATILLKYIISFKKNIFLEVSSRNNIAIKLYNKLGFILNRIRKDYYSIGEDGLEMMRNVDEI